ncbi:MAG: TRAP transporter substrate-binding protein [Shimia sp.]
MTLRATFMAGAAALAFAAPATAAEYEFTFQSFLPIQALIPSQIIDVWINDVEEASGGAIEITQYGAMQLGGTPPELADQVIDGTIDMTYTVMGYTPGRFPTTEVFELPFTVDDAAAASSAYWQMYETHMQEEFAGMKVLATWVHGPGVIHTSEPVNVPGDMQGLKVRGPSRLTNALLSELGATAVGMPVPAIPEAISKGVVDGAIIPWEVTSSLRLSELVGNHTEFEGTYPYTVTFVLAMNQGAYDALPDDMKAVIDDNSGEALSVFAAQTMVNGDAPARQIAMDAGNNVITLSGDEAAAFEAAAQPVIDNWLAEQTENGVDGQALMDEAKALMDAYSGS